MKYKKNLFIKKKKTHLSVLFNTHGVHLPYFLPCQVFIKEERKKRKERERKLLFNYSLEKDIGNDKS